MELTELQRRIDATPELKALKNKLADELDFQSEQSAQFDPITIITIISICVQLFMYCNPNKPKDLKQSIRDIRTLPPRKLIRLRRRMNALYSEKFAGHAVSKTKPNPILTALYDISESADDAALDALIAIAQEEAQ